MGQRPTRAGGAWTRIMEREGEGCPLTDAELKELLGHVSTSLAEALKSFVLLKKAHDLLLAEYKLLREEQGEMAAAIDRFSASTERVLLEVRKIREGMEGDDWWKGKE